MSAKSPRTNVPLSYSKLIAIAAVLGGCALLPAEAQVATAWLPGDGAWSDSAHWTNGTPNSSTADAYIDNQTGTNSIVTLGSGITVGRLRIDSGDMVDFGSNAGSLIVADSAFAGAGELLLNGTLRLPGSSSNGGSSQTLEGTKAINGSGKLQLGSPGLRPEVYGNTTNNGTIEGTGAFGRYNNSSFFHPIFNAGTVNANVADNALIFHSFNGTNTGTMKAFGGGRLLFAQGNINNTGGQILADGSGSIAQIGDFHSFAVTGGTLGAKDGGILRFENAYLKDLTINNLTPNGTVELRDGVTVFDGTVTNNESISIASTGARLDMPFAIFDAGGTVTIAGSGEIVLDSVVNNDPSFSDTFGRWLILGQTIRGRGVMGRLTAGGSSDQIYVTNRGTFQADRNNETFRIDIRRLDNQSGGFLRAIDGGILNLAITETILNTGGTIEALNGGKIEASFARIEGGLIRNGDPAADPPIPPGFIPLGNMTIVNPGTGMRLEGDLKLGLSGANQEAFIIGDIENTGILRIAASTHYARLRIGDSPARSATLSGGGEVILGDAANGSTESALMEFSTNSQTYTLTNTDNTIRGFGRIGDPNYDRWLVLNNMGLIAADVPGKTLQIELRTADNTGGTFRAADGGLLRLWGRFGFDNVDGTLEALNTSPFNFVGATTITGGTIRNVGAASNAANFDLGNATLVNPFVLQGPLIVENAKQAGFVGTIPNQGSVRLRNTSDSTRTRLSIGTSGNPNVSLTGGGELILGDITPAGGSASVEAANGAGTPTLSIDNQTVRGFGVVGFNSSTDRGMNVINNSLIDADVPDKQLAFVPFTMTNSPGKTMKATNGGRLYFHPLQLNNTGATIQAENAATVLFDIQTTLTGGLINSDGGGTIELLTNLTANGGAVFTNAGTLLVGRQGGTRAMSGLANGGSTLINAGTIRKIAAGDYSIHTNLNDTGAVDVQQGILRLFGGGTIANANFAAAAGTDFTLQGAQPWNIAGVNNFTDAGKHWVADTTLQLADPATTLNITNFNVANATLTGPGTINVSSGATFHPYTSANFSGPKLVTSPGSTSSVDLAGAAFLFRNNAQWENSGTVNMGGYINKIDGDTGTLFTNTPTGILRSNAAQENRLLIPYLNKGVFDIPFGTLFVSKAGTFEDASATIANTRELRFESAALSLEGTNTVTGLGFMQMITSPLTFAAGAKLNVDRLGIHAASGVTGGEINVAKHLAVHDYYSPPMVIDSAQVDVADTATGLIEFDGGTLRFQNGARLANGGAQFDIKNSLIELNTNAIFENNGTMNVYNLPTFGGDGTGLFKTDKDSFTKFYTSRTMSWRFDVAGSVHAENGTTVTFDQGGLFDETAKFSPNHPSSNITFTGTGPYISRGDAIEFPGTGYVNFTSTTLQFEPSTIPGDESSIAAGARVAFHGDNTVKSANGVHGTLSATGLVFQSGTQTIDNATLQTFGTANDTVWNATGGKLLLKNGARFLNGARFVIPFSVGELSGDAGTLFHNKASGRIIHETSSTTNFDVDFQNDGYLEFVGGMINFLKTFTGQGGIAVSGGAVVDLGNTSFFDENNLPSGLQSTGAGSVLRMTLGKGLRHEVTNPDAVKVAAGGKLTYIGGQALVALGPTASVIAQGPGSLLERSGGDLVGQDGGTLVGQDGGTLVGQDGGSLVGLDGGTLVGLDGGTLVGQDGGSLVGLDGGTLVGQDGGSLVGQDGGSLVGLDGGTLVGLDGGSLVGLDGGSIMAGLPGGAAAVRRPLVSAKAGSYLAQRIAGASAGGGVIRIEAGGLAKVVGGGEISAQNGGVLMGNGTFEGPGFIRSGGSIRPGLSAGLLTWNGNLTVESGGLLEIEIGGTAVGTQYDRVNVSGAFTMNGALSVRMLNGFGSNVQTTDVFDVVVAGSPISTGLAGSRVTVAGSYGSFEVQLVNGGNTLRLTDFQVIAPTFSSWVERYGLTGANAAWDADPNFNGISNLLEYALGLDPTVGSSTGITTGVIEENGQKYLTLSYTKPTGAEVPTDLIYAPERASSLTAPDWSSSSVDIIPLGSVPGPGSLETVTVRSTHPISATPKEYLHLKVTLQ